MFQLSSPLGFGGRKATSSPPTPNYFLKYEIVKNNYLNFFSAGIYDIEAGRSSSFGETHTSHSSLTQVCDFFFIHLLTILNFSRDFSSTLNYREYNIWFPNTISYKTLVGSIRLLTTPVDVTISMNTQNICVESVAPKLMIDQLLLYRMQESKSSYGFNEPLCYILFFCSLIGKYFLY